MWRRSSLGLRLRWRQEETGGVARKIGGLEYVKILSREFAGGAEVLEDAGSFFQLRQSSHCWGLREVWKEA